MGILAGSIVGAIVLGVGMAFVVFRRMSRRDRDRVMLGQGSSSATAFKPRVEPTSGPASSSAASTSTPHMQMSQSPLMPTPPVSLPLVPSPSPTMSTGGLKTVLYDYTPTTSDEVAVSAGDVVSLLELHSDWAIVKTEPGGVVGMVPASFLR